MERCFELINDAVRFFREISPELRKYLRAIGFPVKRIVKVNFHYVPGEKSNEEEAELHVLLFDVENEQKYFMIIYKSGEVPPFLYLDTLQDRRVLPEGYRNEVLFFLRAIGEL